MSQSATTRDSQNYLDALGLRAEPFASLGQSLPMYRAPGVQKAIDAALYIARNSDLVALIHGPAGSGKTTLFHALATRAGANVHVVSIAGSSGVGVGALREQILASFHLVEPLLDADEQLRQIREQITLLQRKGYQCLILVDDADALPRESYVLLEMLMNIRHDRGKNLVNLILFAPRPNSLQFDGPTLRHRIKPVALTPLSADEVRLFIADRLALAGNAALVDEVFRERDLARIARESKGWPGAICALAQQRLLRHVGRTTPASTPPDAPAFATAQIALASLFGVALVSAFVFQKEINAWLGVTAPDTTAGESVTPATPGDPLLASTMATTVASYVEAPAPVEPILPVSTPEPEAADEGAVSQTPLATREAPTTVASNSPAAPPHAADWLLTQNPAAYTIQLIGSTDEGDVRRALKRAPPEDARATFVALRNSKPVFGLVQGIYPDMASAQQARQRLPEPLARNAWVRRISAVQQEIARNDAAPATSTVAGPPN